jgi:precorrin-6Y C5,15-methyltransferase (decarboxylating)
LSPACPHEWIAHPAPSTFTLAAARLGWAIQDLACLGLHAAPFARLRPHLAPGRRALVLLRDGAAVGDLARWLTDLGFGASTLHVLEALGGPRERLREGRADAFTLTDIAHPVAVGLSCAGSGPALALTPGRDDTLFASDGQITKAPVRALTLAALAPARASICGTSARVPAPSASSGCWPTRPTAPPPSRPILSAPAARGPMPGRWAPTA